MHRIKDIAFPVKGRHPLRMRVVMLTLQCLKMRRRLPLLQVKLFC